MPDLPAPPIARDDLIGASSLDELIRQTAERLHGAGLIESVDDPDGDPPAQPLTTDGFRTLLDLTTWWELLSGADSASPTAKLAHDIGTAFRLALVALMVGDDQHAVEVARRRAIGALRRANKTHRY